MAIDRSRRWFLKKGGIAGIAGAWQQGVADFAYVGFACFGTAVQFFDVVVGDFEG